MSVNTQLIISESDIDELVSRNPESAVIRLDDKSFLSSQKWDRLLRIYDLSFYTGTNVSCAECKSFFSKLPSTLSIFRFGHIDETCLNLNLFSHFSQLKELSLVSGSSNPEIKRETVEKFCKDGISLSCFTEFGFEQYLSGLQYEKFDGERWTSHCDR